MPSLGQHPYLMGRQWTVAPGREPRRSMSQRWDNVLRRIGRPLTTANAPDHPAGPRAAGSAPVWVSPVRPAEPFVLRTLPRRRIGPVPKLAPGKQGTGLGQSVGAGFQTLDYSQFAPLENAPSTQPSFRLKIPRTLGGFYDGARLSPTYTAKPFYPATRQFNQARSSMPWAQAHFPPQQRPLTPAIQSMLIRRPAAQVRRQIPAGQNNPAIYTIGYPTRVGVAARLGGGPIAVLGGNSQ